jgi:hypothetical protein
MSVSGDFPPDMPAGRMAAIRRDSASSSHRDKSKAGAKICAKPVRYAYRYGQAPSHQKILMLQIQRCIRGSHYGCKRKPPASTVQAKAGGACGKRSGTRLTLTHW